MSAEIVNLFERLPFRSHPVLTQVEAYWDGLRDGRDAPSRAEVDPRGLSGVLRHCFVLERVAPGLARFRVAGQSICDQMGLEMKGMPLSTVFLPEARDQLESVVERVFSQPETARLAVCSPSGFKRSRIDGQLLLLPLRSDLGAISRAMGCIALNDIGGRKPRRLDILAAEQRAIPRGRRYLTRPSARAQDTPTKDADIIALRLSPDAPDET